MHIGIYVTHIFTREKGGRGIRPTTCATVMIRFLWDRVTWWYYNRNRDTHCSQSEDRVSRQQCHSTVVKLNSSWIDSFSPCFFGKPKALKDALNQSARRFCSTRFTWQSSECRWTFVWGEYRSVTWYKHCLALMKATRGAIDQFVDIHQVSLATFHSRLTGDQIENLWPSILNSVNPKSWFN